MPKSPHIVCFGAHPDDAEIFTGGLLAAFKAKGAKVTIVIGTDGSLSHGYPANIEVAARRKQEAQAGAAILGAELEMLGFPDGYLSLASEAMAAINARLEALRPDLVITHHVSDPHRDHREMSRLVTARVDPNQKLIYMEPIFGLSASPTLLADISDHWDKKEASIRVHDSQFETEANLGDIINGIKTWNKFRALQFGSRARRAEGYIVPPSPFQNPQPLIASVTRVRAL